MNDAHQSVRRWRVSGRVQGVGFRDATQREARRLGICAGWARNLADGDVDVCARGPAAAVDALGQWLRRGPAMARVSQVAALEPPGEVGAGFVIR